MEQTTSGMAIVISYVLDDTYKTLVLDCVDNERVTLSTNLTQYPVVTGEMMADHAIHEPAEMSITGMYTVNSSNVERLTGNTSGIKTVKDFQTEIERLRNESVLCTITKQTSGDGQAKFLTRKNMVCNNISWEQGINSVTYSLSFKEVLMSTIDENVTAGNMPSGDEIYVQNSTSVIDIAALKLQTSSNYNKSVVIDSGKNVPPATVTDALANALNELTDGNYDAAVETYMNEVYSPSLEHYELDLPKKVGWFYERAISIITIGNDTFEFWFVPNTTEASPVTDWIQQNVLGAGSWAPTRVIVKTDRKETISTTYLSSAILSEAEALDSARIIPASYTDRYVYLMLMSYNDEGGLVAGTSKASKLDELAGQKVCILVSKKSIQDMNNEVVRLARGGK